MMEEEEEVSDAETATVDVEGTDVSENKEEEADRQAEEELEDMEELLGEDYEEYEEEVEIVDPLDMTKTKKVSSLLFEKASWETFNHRTGTISYHKGTLGQMMEADSSNPVTQTTIMVDEHGQVCASRTPEQRDAIKHVGQALKNL